MNNIDAKSLLYMSVTDAAYRDEIKKKTWVIAYLVNVKRLDRDVVDDIQDQLIIDRRINVSDTGLTTQGKKALDDLLGSDPVRKAEYDKYQKAVWDYIDLDDDV